MRDQSIKRMYDDDGLVMLAAPITGTSYDSFGARIGDKRSMASTKKINAGDAEAILEERNSFLVDYVIPQYLSQVLFCCCCWGDLSFHFQNRILQNLRRI